MKRALSIIALLASSTGLYAAPSITSATTTDTVRGAVVTIGGSSFGTKSPATPRIWADFEDGSINPSSKGSVTSWDEIQGLARITSGTAYGDSIAMVNGTMDDTNTSASFRHDLTHWTTIYMALDRRYDYASSTQNHKIWRLWPSAGGNDYVCSTFDGGQCYNEAADYLKRDPPDANASFVANRWYHERWLWEHGTDVACATTGDGQMLWYQDGVLMVNQTDLPNCDKDLLQLRVADNFCSDATACPDPGQVFMDNIYIDSTYSRVEISTSTTYATSTKLNPLILQSWSSTEITGELHLGDISPTSTLYAYVTDAENSTNANGFQITESAGGGATKPVSCPCR